jgi:hypothetical protein
MPAQECGSLEVLILLSFSLFNVLKAIMGLRRSQLGYNLFLHNRNALSYGKPIRCLAMFNISTW